MRRQTFSLLLLLALTGCKTLFGSDGNVQYAQDAKINLARGMESFKSRDFPAAEKYFEYVRTKYPYSEFAKDAELKLADIGWEKEDFTDARDRYTNFVKLHPGYARTDYAAYRAAACHYQEFKKAASDFFLFPPTFEKDQTELAAASRSLSDFVALYPQSKYAAEATKYLNESRHRLAAHELYVAGFYAKRNYWEGAAGRWANVVKLYPSLGEDREAAFKLADAYRVHLHQPGKANDVLRLIMDRYPNSPDAARAQSLIHS